ncbi:MAG: DoxX family protein [Bacteroidota bacterium]|nr:DoxX family protein [Bacteroidota bacterium]
MEFISDQQLVSLFQVVIGLSVMRVWTINFNKSTPWRGGGARNMKEEFTAYGLPMWMVYFVGILKVIFSIGLIAGLWIPELISFSASGIAIFMFFAILMHVKIKDPIKKSIPALTFMVLSLLIIFLEN